MMFDLLFHSTPRDRFQEMLFPKTERKQESGISMRVNAIFSLVQTKFQSFFCFVTLSAERVFCNI